MNDETKITKAMQVVLDAVATLRSRGERVTDNRIGEILNRTEVTVRFHRKRLEAMGAWPLQPTLWSRDFGRERRARFLAVAGEVAAEGGRPSTDEVCRRMEIPREVGLKVRAAIEAAGEWPHGEDPPRTSARQLAADARRAEFLARARAIAARGEVPSPTEIGKEMGYKGNSWRHLVGRLVREGSWTWDRARGPKTGGARKLSATIYYLARSRPPRRGETRPGKPVPPELHAREAPSLGGPEDTTIDRRKRKAMIRRIWREIKQRKRIEHARTVLLGPPMSVRYQPTVPDTIDIDHDEEEVA